MEKQIEALCGEKSNRKQAVFRGEVVRRLSGHGCIRLGSSNLRQKQGM